MAAVNWIKIQNVSLARAVRDAGFDISVFEQNTKAIRNEIKKSGIKKVIENLEDAYYRQSARDLRDINKGVYVICLSNPFTIQYKKGQSEIIYIGRGNVLGRLAKHFQSTLFDFMQSVSGTNFDFFISEPKRRGGGISIDYYKQIEFSLLQKFEQKFGGHGGQYPLLNKNAGSDKGLLPGKGWDKPLSRAGKTPSWALHPTKYGNFTKLGD